MLMTKEHYDLMGQFEREHRGRRMDRESKESWPRGIIYQDGHVNELFAAYRRGYAFAVADYRSDLQNLEASRDGYRRDAERLQTEIDTLKSSKAEQSEEGTPPASAQPERDWELSCFYCNGSGHVFVKRQVAELATDVQEFKEDCECCDGRGFTIAFEDIPGIEAYVKSRRTAPAEGVIPVREKYEYALARLGLKDSPSLRVIFWDALDALEWEHVTDTYITPLSISPASAQDDAKDATPAARWRDKGEPDPHAGRYDVERAALPMGKLSDDELANGVFMHYNAPLNLQGIMAGTHSSPIAWVTAAKDRIRWLSRKLEEAQAAPAAGDARVPSINIEAAAKAMAECMDYPWAHMPEQGRATMREHAQTVIRAASQQQEG